MNMIRAGGAALTVGSDASSVLLFFACDLCIWALQACSALWGLHRHLLCALE